MVTVDTSDLEGSVKDGLVEFIESKLPVKSEKEGEVVTFEDKSPRTHVTSPEIRTYLKRYIHSKELRKQYRIMSESGSLKFVKQKVEEEEEEEEEEKEK
jgi:uncharacterized protein YuzE